MKHAYTQNAGIVNSVVKTNRKFFDIYDSILSSRESAFRSLTYMIPFYHREKAYLGLVKMIVVCLIRVVQSKKFGVICLSTGWSS